MDIQTFTAPQGSRIRTTIVEGEPWFVAVDVCRALDIMDTRQAIERLDDDERGVCRVPTPGGTQETRTVSESGLYSLILGSRKPEAKEFKRWVTREVLPTIRKTGSYAFTLETTAFQVPKTLSEALRLAADQQEQIEAQALHIESQKPAVEFVADLVDTKSLTTLSDAAKEFGYGPKEFANMLEARKILFKRTKGGPWIAKQEHLDAGRFEVKVWMGNGYTKPTTCLTGKGLVWLRSVLKPAASTFDGLFGEMVA